MSKHERELDPFDEGADPLLRDRARAWLPGRSRHLSEAELAAMAHRSPQELEHLLDCEECGMRLSTQLAGSDARRRELRRVGPRPVRWAAAATVALLILGVATLGAPFWMRERPAASPAVEASLLHDPAALRSPDGSSSIVSSQLPGGRLSILLSVETPAEALSWEVEPPSGEALRGQLLFPPNSAEYKEFVLRLRLGELLPSGSGDLTVRAHDPGGQILGQWQLRVQA